MVKLAVGSSGDSLQFAAEKLRGDRELCLAAVKGCGTALRHAAALQRDDKALVQVCACERERERERRLGSS